LSLSAWFSSAVLASAILLFAADGAYAQGLEGSLALELQKNWQLISAEKLTATGDTISQPSFSTDKWYPIQRMPATVLEILQEDGVYPNLYFGMNLVNEVPHDLYKQDWWYRTNFEVPPGQHTFWMDFPGINYRAEIWLNGTRLGDKNEIVGMYVDHQFNVTNLIHPGETNALAVRVTPERLLQYVNGVELGDDWANWINYQYFKYQGPLDAESQSFVPAKNHIAVSYKSADGSEAFDADAKVTIASASTSSVTLSARHSSGKHSASSETAWFFVRGKLLGDSPVSADGVATLTVTDREDLNEVESGVNLPAFLWDRNAGVWKPVTLYATGAVKLSNALVNTDLPLPSTTPASLTVHVNVANGSSADVAGTVEGEISRDGKSTIKFSQPIRLAAGETREVTFAPGEFSQLVVRDPDLWWPYTLGNPALYNIQLKFIVLGHESDSLSARFGIRQVTQHRDQDEQFASVGKGGNFYLQINGRDYLIRGGAYTPDLLYRDDPDREATAIRYAKDLGLNMIRWESKISSERILNMADEAGIPVMFGWMCCEQWELWRLWSDEDRKVAQESLRSQILMLRSHAAAFIWANGSDGLPPHPIRDQYHAILKDLHWQNAVVDTVSSFAIKPDGEREWDGIHMQGPYTWRPPTFWFSGKYVGARGSCAEQGDNESVQPYESLRKFIPADKLWPINEYWSFHSGALRGSNLLNNARLELDNRYGPSASAQDFSRKAQLGAYEDTRAQFEDYAANGWQNHKMTIYWMLNSVWPSFYAHLYDYYQKPGGGYFGAKKGLRPLSIVFDAYARGDHSSATVTVTNQTPVEQDGLRAKVRIYDLEGKMRLEQSADDVRVAYGGAVAALKLPRLRDIGPVYFVRCELFDRTGRRVAENVYWQSLKDDDIGGYPDRNADDNPPLDPKRVTWADFTALNTMPRAKLEMEAVLHHLAGNRNEVEVKLHNPSTRIAFFERLEVTADKGGNEILPITYSDNYVSVFPGETETVFGTYDATLGGPGRPWLKLEGYNTSEQTAPVP